MKSLTPQQKLHAWFDTQLGASLLETEIKEVGRILPKIYGDFLIKIDGPNAKWEKFLATSTIPNKIYLTSEYVKSNICTIQCHYNALPLRSESVDAALIHHALEFSADPRAILEESCRILTPTGCLIIIGFNPASLWGIGRSIALIKESFRHSAHIANDTASELSPWHAQHFISISHLKNWLRKLDFTIVDTNTFYFRPPLTNIELLKKMAFFEKLGKLSRLPCGGYYILTAQKKVAAVTPLKRKEFVRARTAMPPLN